jgi:NADPH-dependent 2,4-dienoyl-CoA reductase/sulfur reductase-like enzyme
LGPVLAVAPMTALLSSAIGPSDPGALARAVVIGAGLAAGLGAYAAHRAGQMRTG